MAWPEIPLYENTVSQAVDCSLVEDICSDTRMTRSEFIAQLDSLKLHGFRVLWVGGLSFMLITWPLAFHSFCPPKVGPPLEISRFSGINACVPYGAESAQLWMHSAESK